MNLTSRLRSAGIRIAVEARIRQGWSRVRSAFWPVMQAVLAAGVAYVVAGKVLGHSSPFFAPVSAWVALGFNADRELRRVAELAVGVALGVGLGDVLVRIIGSGAWQIAAVLAVAALIARFIDRGPMLTTQAGVQSIVIVGLPSVAASGGSLGRWTDAVVGGLVALAVAALIPRDVRRRPREQGRTAVEELAAMLGVLARGMRTQNTDELEDALRRGRATEPALAEWQDACAAASDLAKVAPAAHRHRTELEWLNRSAVRTDRAVRNARVLARRAVATLDVPDHEHEHDLTAVGDIMQRIALAAEDLAAALGSGAEPLRAATSLLVLAEELDPFRLAPDDWQVQSLVLLIRSLVVDLLEASGVDSAQAHDAMPEI